ncbi:MAG: single-stranded DNA-binding protein [Acetobacteraceae bacterium]|nr:single-stranded DNA-binding protein [Acetobacteraceae bacterium]
MYLNRVTLIGFVGNAPDIREAKNGTTIVNFSLATKTSWKNENGDYDSRTEWHRVVCFAKRAEWAASRIEKGMHLYIEGELRSHEYSDTVEVSVGENKTKDISVTRRGWQVFANSIQKIDRPQRNGQSTDPAPEPEPQQQSQGSDVKTAKEDVPL